MAIGAITVDASPVINSGQTRFTDFITFAGDGAYPTGGSAIAAAIKAKIGANRDILDVREAGLCGGFVVRWDYANQKLIVLSSNGAAPAALAEFTNAGNLSGTTFKLRIESR
jgi:hypothetical protein